MAELHTRDGEEQMGRFHDKMLLVLAGISIISCCATGWILVTKQDELSKIFLSLAGGN